ncbi:response regulator [Spirochaeta lutea]|uniref:Chemotaxis protein CheY n=1 Tax=Spirochaeta lutea TaxID=1480694 RepID=A0A098QVT9_9SPIO|nr:HD domain-containing phosphohydrolase [Spirochaeta lutea]KGE71691.1 chemotaxis protein CheY [Spirochaeta lutea]
MEQTDLQDTILIIDDSPSTLAVLDDILNPYYRIKAAKEGYRGIQIAESDDPPDLILLDILMPEMDGYEVCKSLKKNPRTRDIPVIFVTAKDETEDEAQGLELGAVDYLVKPVAPLIVLARVRNHLELRAARNHLTLQNRELERRVRERTKELTITQDVTIASLAGLAETRDKETGSHIWRTQNYVRTLAISLPDLPGYAQQINDEDIYRMYKSAPLHDIGKVGIPDAILQKPGPLTKEEFEIMKSHTTLGYQALLQAEQSIGTTSFLRYAREIVYTHHEKWDGTGYPQGLSGEDIPLAGRIMAIADVYDALISKRVYKQPFPHSLAVQTILDGSGTHFDPTLVQVFQGLTETFRNIARSGVELSEEREALER